MYTSEMEFKAIAIGEMAKETDGDGEVGMPTFSGLAEEEEESGKGPEKKQSVRLKGNQAGVVSRTRKYSTVVNAAGGPRKRTGT